MYHQRFKTIDQRFAEKHTAPVEGCWLWKGKDKDYPKFWDGSGYVRASPFVLSRSLGRPLEKGEEACHKCDNPRCVRPDHLFAGTHSDNMADREAKKRGRQRFGAENHKTKLTADQVRQIRREYPAMSQDKLAAKYGVSQVTISALLRRITWVAVQDE